MEYPSTQVFKVFKCLPATSHLKQEQVTLNLCFFLGFKRFYFREVFVFTEQLSRNCRVPMYPVLFTVLLLTSALVCTFVGFDEVTWTRHCHRKSTFPLGLAPGVEHSVGLNQYIVVSVSTVSYRIAPLPSNPLCSICPSLPPPVPGNH
jgi:hypothetical protein